MNPIENAWGKLKQEVPTKYIKRQNVVIIRDCAHFHTVLQATWKQLKTDVCVDLKTVCTDIPARLKQAIQKKGEDTSY